MILPYRTNEQPILEIEDKVMEAMNKYRFPSKNRIVDYEQVDTCSLDSL